jgi:hypothetical protein
MPEIEMPPQDARGTYADPHDTQGHVAEAIITKAHQRITDWVTQVTLAVTEFERAANGHIDQLEYDHDAHVEGIGLVQVFITAVESVIPGERAAVEVAKAVGAKVAEVIVDGLADAYNSGIDGSLASAKLKLHNTVRSLAQAVSVKASHAYDGIDDRLREAVDDAMTWVDSSSMDDGYIASMVDYMGFVQPTRQNTLDPIRQQLENEFFGMYQKVRFDLEQSAGHHPGGYANQWEHEAHQYERALYKEEGERAWDDAYKENPPDAPGWEHQ